MAEKKELALVEELTHVNVYLGADMRPLSPYWALLYREPSGDLQGMYGYYR